MFDTVVIDGLKLKAPKEVTSFLKSNNAKFPSEFQTKDLDNFLSTYKINVDGQIYQEVRKLTGKRVPYKNPFDSWKDNRPLLERIYWKIKYKDSSYSLDNRLVEEVKLVNVKSKLTETFEIYTIEEVSGRYLELSYSVKAVDGKVKTVHLNKWSIESEKDSKKRNEENKEFQDKMNRSFAAQKEFRSKWYYPVLKETYNPFIFFSRLLVQKICNKIITWSYRWTGV